MALDTDRCELADVELDLVSGGKQKQTQELMQKAMELQKEAGDSGFGKGFGGASSLA